METRILQDAVRRLSERLSPPPQLLSVERQAPERVVLLLEGPSLGGRAGLVLDVHPAHPTLHLATIAGQRSFIQTGGFAERMTGTWLAGVQAAPDPRAHRLVFVGRETSSPRFFLAGAWIGRAGNLWILDGQARVLESLLPRGQEPGELYQAPASFRRAVDAPIDRTGILQHLQGHPVEEWPRRLARARREISLAEAVDLLARALAEAGVDATDSSIKLADLAGSWKVESVPQTNTEAPTGTHLYLIPRRARVIGGLSLTAEALGLPAALVTSRDLAVLSPFAADQPGGLMPALAVSHDALLLRERDEILRQAARRRLHHETSRVQRLRQHLLDERGPIGHGPFLRRAGEAILTHIRTIRRGDRELVCPDWSGDDREPLHIPLEPAKSPAENAQIYFHRARRWERGEPHRVKRLQQIEAATARLSALGTELDNSESPPDSDQLERWCDEALGFLRQEGRKRRSATNEEAGSTTGPLLGSKGSSNRDSKGADRSGKPVARGATEPGAKGSSRPGPGRPAFHPRSFTTRDGWTVLVGRTNAENDYLTHRLAHPEDYWFHVHGMPGSHVVLRREGRKNNPSAKTIEEAAAIAAFYSKARHSSKAPVIYTLKKYVRKPRQSKPGLAMCTREKMVMVRPEDPAKDQSPEWMED